MYRNNDILKIENIQKKYFFITWRMTGWCNYKCPYCINNIRRAGFTDWRNEDDIIEAARQLNTLIHNNNIEQPIKLKLIGGEVCFYNLPKVLSYLDKIDRLIVVSNFSRPVEYYKELYEYCKSRNIYLLLVLSYHEENVEYFKKAVILNNICRDNNYPEPQFSFVITDDFDFKYIDQLEASGITRLKFAVCRDDDANNTIVDPALLSKLKYYTDKFNRSNASTYQVTFKDGTIEKFSNIYQFLNFLDNNGLIPDDYTCDISKNSLVVFYNNDLFYNRCQYMLNTKLGNLSDSGLIIPRHDITCKLNSLPGGQKRCTLCSSNSIYRQNKEMN